MAVLTPADNVAESPPEPTDPAGSEVEALFPEAEYHQRWRHKRLIVAITSVAIAAVVIGLVVSGGHSSPSSRTSAAGRKFVTDASTESNNAGTTHIVQTSVAVSKGTPRYTSTTVTTYDFEPATGVWRRVSTYPSGYYEVELMNRTTGYYQVSETPPTSTATPDWFSFPLGTIKNPTPVPLSPAGKVGGVSGKVTKIGTKMIDGTKVTGYSYTISVALLLRQATTAAQRDSYISSYVDDDVKSFPGQTWIDSSGHIRETWFQPTRKLGYPFDGLATITNTELYSTNRTALHVNYPSASDTTAEPSESAANAAAGEHPYR